MIALSDIPPVVENQNKKCEMNYAKEEKGFSKHEQMVKLSINSESVMSVTTVLLSLFPPTITLTTDTEERCGVVCIGYLLCLFLKPCHVLPSTQIYCQKRISDLYKASLPNNTSDSSYIFYPHRHLFLKDTV